MDVNAWAAGRDHDHDHDHATHGPTSAVPSGLRSSCAAAGCLFFFLSLGADDDEWGFAAGRACHATDLADDAARCWWELERWSARWVWGRLAFPDPRRRVGNAARTFDFGSGERAKVEAT